MVLNKEQIEILLSVVSSASNDELDCEGCFNYVAQFVETKLAGRTLCESMKLVEEHLANCSCCEDEFQALKAAIEEVGVGA